MHPVRVGFEEEPEDALLAGVAAELGPRVIASDRELAGARDALSAYLEGDASVLDLPVDLGFVHAPFRRAVLETLHDTVRRGEVVTYGALASRSGRPKAFRAAATACARNPVPIVVPCASSRVAPSRACAWERAPAAKKTQSPGAGFAGMGCVEVLVHGSDIAYGLGPNGHGGQKYNKGLKL